MHSNSQLGGRPRQRRGLSGLIDYTLGMAFPDPILLQLTRSLLEAAAEDMGTTLQRVAFSANIKERRDFSCAIFDAAGRMLAQAAHIPVHLGAMPASVAAVLAHFENGVGDGSSAACGFADQHVSTREAAREELHDAEPSSKPSTSPLREGDVAVVNDPYTGGSHLPDITLVSPIYVAGTCIGYAASRAHHADVGGISPGSFALAKHIDEEGYRMPPTILYTADGANAAVMGPFLGAVRNPAERLGDLEAQLAANTVGSRAVQRLVGQFGVDHLAVYSQALLDYSAAFMRRAIASIPPGVYRFEDVMDGDGFDAVNIPIRAVVIIDGEKATVDLTGSADAVPGPINCPRAVACSAVYYCFCCLMDATVPLNQGCFSAIEVITRPGSIVDAVYPSPVVAGNTETSQRIVDVVLGALAQALPDSIPAASSGTMSSLTFGSRGSGDVWTYYETIAGGAGAGPRRPGAHAVHTHMTNTLNTPAEAMEMQYPLRVRRFERAIGTGGLGKHAGGDGVVREIEILADVSGTVLSERRANRPWGLAGGSPGMVGVNSIVRWDGSEESIGGKAAFTASVGDRVKIITSGGGGWGA
jgi:N-methylhydantoinase B